jgi:hypothetical protein
MVATRDGSLAMLAEPQWGQTGSVTSLNDRKKRLDRLRQSPQR